MINMFLSKWNFHVAGQHPERELPDREGANRPLVPAPCVENDKINVLDEPYFGTHILGNYLPFQTSEIPKKNTQPLISGRGLAGL